MITHQVGDLIHFQSDDPEFASYDEAADYALKQSNEFDEEFFGIWADGGELVAIAHQGDIFFNGVPKSALELIDQLQAQLNFMEPRFNAMNKATKSLMAVLKVDNISEAVLAADVIDLASARIRELEKARDQERGNQ